MPYLRQSSAMLCSPRIPSITIKTFCSEVKIRFVLRRIPLTRILMFSAENLLKDSFLLSLCKYTFLLIIQTKTPNLIEAQVVHFCLTTYNFTYMDFSIEVQRCIYTTNWIERLNRKYKRTISMRTSMPSDKAVIFLLAAVAMEETKKTYPRRIYQFKNWKERIKNEWKERTE